MLPIKVANNTKIEFRICLNYGALESLEAHIKWTSIYSDIESLIF